MPLPDPTPVRVQAPVRAGVGLRAVFAENIGHRFPPADWPEDWWQRNYDTPILDPDSPGPLPFTDRMLRLPPAPGT